MKLVFIIGSGAVGKMTVGQELAKRTGLKLFYNHVTIEPVLELFGNFNVEAIKGMRDVIFREFAKTDNQGMIFTFMWAFDQPADREYVEHVMDFFRPYDTEFYFVELIADQAVRLERNKSENRLKYKPSKRSIEESDQRLIRHDAKYRLVSLPGEISYPNYLRLDNTHITAEDAARQIQQHFGL